MISSSPVTTIMLFMLHTLTNEEQMSTLPQNMMCQPFEGGSSAYCVDLVIFALLLFCLYC